MRISQAFLPLVAATLMIAGCGNKEPATSAVSQADAAMEKLRPEASRFAPEELKVADATLARMKASLADGKYQDVIKEIPQINGDVKAAQDAVVSMQTLTAAAAHEWDELNKEVPQTVQEIEARVTTLSGGKLPKDITKETLATAKTELESMKTTWAEATAAATAGDTLQATEKGRSVQVKGEKLKDDLGMSAEAKVASLY